MTPRIRAGAMGLAAMLSLTACADRSDLQADALARWKAYCASQHKQFLWHDTTYDEGVVMHSVQIQGRCVGPGEKGYVPPAPPDNDDD